jgi:energy-converting hydrogenase A subunit R
MKFICFDLEGPLAPQDNAYELMKLFPNGDKLFEVISRYDDLLTLRKREGYEPGDTLALIVPFLVYHNISEKTIESLAAKSGLTPGAFELFQSLHSQKWETFCISTSYEQYARNITLRLNIPFPKVACTIFPLDRLRASLAAEDFSPIEQVEKDMLEIAAARDDARIEEMLDKFYWEKLSLTNFGRVMRAVKPVGGTRKVEALKRFSHQYHIALSDWVVVGDSITDYQMLESVDRAGGLSIAFNANEYALPYATMGLASTSLLDLTPVLKSWEGGERAQVEKLVKEKEKVGGKDTREHYHWLAGQPLADSVVQTHKRIRRLVRQEAAKLG